MRVVSVLVAVVLCAGAYGLVQARHVWIHAVTTYDAKPSPPAQLGAGTTGPGLSKTERTRVILVDGLRADTARTLHAWSTLCDRGARMTVDVGFPTISLPVEVALWTGLTQQQTGIVGHGDKQLDPPLDRRGIPAQVAGSIASAESHDWIVKSLGFQRVGEFAAAGDDVASASPLVFVHVLRVDDAGHHSGADSDDYREAARSADSLIASLVLRAPGARWFLLSDHGHLPGGGHGGDERELRQVEGCIAGSGVPTGTGVVHVVDIARAIADSTGATLDTQSLGRPYTVAIANPLAGDLAVPPLALTAGALAIILVAAGLAGTSFVVRRWWLGPWWFPAACALLVAIAGEPTMSMPMTYQWTGRTMYLAWLGAMPIAAAVAYLGRTRAPLLKVVLGQLVLPVAVVAAAITACGGWSAMFGADVAPVVPRYTAWVSALLLMVAHGALAVALGLLATLVPRGSGRRSPAEPPRTQPSAAA